MLPKRPPGWWSGYFWGLLGCVTAPLWYPIFLLAVYTIPVKRP